MAVAPHAADRGHISAMVDRCRSNRRSHGNGRLHSGFLPAVVSPPGLLLTFTGLLEVAFGKMLSCIRPLPVPYLICPSPSPAVPITFNLSSRASAGPLRPSVRSAWSAATRRVSTALSSPGKRGLSVSELTWQHSASYPSQVGGAGQTCSIWMSPFELL